jgi:hypothetical protein
VWRAHLAIYPHPVDVASAQRRSAVGPDGVDLAEIGAALRHDLVLEAHQALIGLVNLLNEVNGHLLSEHFNTAAFDLLDGALSADLPGVQPAVSSQRFGTRLGELVRSLIEEAVLVALTQ